MALTPSRELAQAMLGGEPNEAWKAVGGADGIKKLLAQRDEVSVKASAAFRDQYGDRLVKPAKVEK